MKDFKIITFYTNKNRLRTLHIETEHGIINIRIGLNDMQGRSVTSVEVVPDTYHGEIPVKRVGPCNTRLVKLKNKRKPTP